MTGRRELPTYTISEAAHYLSVPAATIRYWSVGRAAIYRSSTFRLLVLRRSSRS